LPPRQNADGAFHGELSYAAFAGFGDRDRNFLLARRSFSGVAEDKRDQIVFRRTNPSNCKLQSEEGVLLGWDLAERIVGSEFERYRAARSGRLQSLDCTRDKKAGPSTARQEEQKRAE